MRRENLAAPLLLSVASRRAPQLPLTHRIQHTLSDERLTDALRIYGGIHPSVLEDSSLMRLVLPSIRTDLMMNEKYQYRAEPPLACPVLGFMGDTDTACTEQQLREWRVQTSQSFQSQVFRGGHFFIATQTEPVVRMISNALLNNR